MSEEKHVIPEEENKDVVVTEEMAAKYASGGGIPKAIRKQVVEINRQKKLQAVKKTDKGIQQKKKIDLFIEEFLRNGGNATRAALVVFNCSSIESAGAMGSHYLKRAKALKRIYLEKKGYGLGKLLEVATKKMEESKSPEWWDRIMKLTDYENFIDKQQAAPVSVNVFQAHKSFVSDYIEDAEEVKDEINIDQLEPEIEEESDENRL